MKAVLTHPAVAQWTAEGLAETELIPRFETD
jgi:hypothetical protein